MSEEHNGNESSETDGHSVNRRRFVKTLGAASGASAFGLGGVGTSAAQSNKNTEDENSDLDPEEVTAAKAQEVVSQVLNSSEYKNLRNELRKKEQYSPNTSDSTVLRANDKNGILSFIVDFPLQQVPGADSVPDGKEDVADMAMVLRENEVVYTKGVVLIRDTIEAQSEILSTTSSTDDEIQLTATSYEFTDGEIESQTQKAAIGSQSEIEGDFTTMKSAGCFSCELVGDAACTVGCGLGIAAVCAGSYVANLAAGYGCTIVAGAFCSIVTSTSERYAGISCVGDYSVEFICCLAGYCSGPC